MKKKLLSLVLSVAAISVISLAASPAWSADPYGPGYTSQQRRITQGVRSGEITRPEWARLQHEQHRIHRYAQHARANGHVDKGERRHLAHMKHRADRHIYRAKHNHKRACHVCRPVPRPVHGHPGPCRHLPAGSFRGAVVQPGVAVAWNIGLH